MQKIYVRPISLSYGSNARNLIKLKQALPICGIQNIAFSKVEIITRGKSNKSKNINVSQIKTLTKQVKLDVLKKIKNITQKRKKLSGLDLSKFNIFGVLNVTPDSFSDGGKFNKLKQALKHSHQMINDGANVIDVGGESTRPGAKLISIEQEKKRVLQIISKIKKYKVSIDTRKSEVMIAAVKKGAKIINDVSALDFDLSSLEVVSKLKKPVILNHSQGTPDIMQNNPKYQNVLLDIYDYFENKVNQLTKRKFLKQNIILDPGIGFGKNLDHNLNLISNIGLFHSLGCPIMLGPSRKSFIGRVMKEKDSKQRLGGTLSAVITGYNQGVQCFRVHDIKETFEALKIQEALNSI
ncbi:MAG: dihydropteroate synthase [Pelagibacteraceae bacterium]